MVSDTVLVGLISGVFGALAAAIPAYLTTRHAPSKRVSDTAVIVDATGKVIATLREEIDRLDGELEDAREEIGRLKETIAQLQEQVRGLGGVPVNGKA